MNINVLKKMSVFQFLGGLFNPSAHCNEVEVV